MNETREYFLTPNASRSSTLIAISNTIEKFYNCLRKTLSPATLNRKFDRDHVKEDFVNFRRKSKQPNTGSKFYSLQEKHSHWIVHHHRRATRITTINTEASFICWKYVLGGFDGCYESVIGSSGVSKDGIVVHIHSIYLIFLSGWVQRRSVPLLIGVYIIHMSVTDPETTIKDRNEQF